MIHPIFQDCKTFAGLELKPIKCVLVPLCEWSEEVQKGITRWLHKNIPEWENFKVAPTAKLLGFFLGPHAGSQKRAGPLKKYASRLQAIKNGQASVAINAFTYNTRVVPVASYVSQLIPLPDSFTEGFDILSVIRCVNCLRHSDMFELHKYGGPKIRSISVACTAALTRTALKTVTEWPKLLLNGPTGSDKCNLLTMSSLPLIV